jgi:hypothetical protein
VREESNNGVGGICSCHIFFSNATISSQIEVRHDNQANMSNQDDLPPLHQSSGGLESDDGAPYDAFQAYKIEEMDLENSVKPTTGSTGRFQHPP